MTLPIPQMALIDLDGTLVDSVPELALCVDAMLRALARPECGEAAVRLWVGNGVERLVKRALTGEFDGEPASEEFALGLRIFNELYRLQNGRACHLYPGVREGLDALAARRIRLGCVTNKPERFTLPLLEQFGIRAYFDTVVAGDSLAVKKPDPGPLLYAAEQLDCPPASALMVGDSQSDVKAARAAGFHIVCLSYGYNHGRDIREMNPDAVIDSLSELDGLFADTADQAHSVNGTQS